MESGLIMFDGISGSGKEGRVANAVQFLESQGIDTVSFTEPTYLRQEIKEFRKDSDRDPRKELDLFIESRKRGLEDYKSHLFTQGKAAVGNRGIISSYVYQSLQGVPLEEIVAKNSFYPTPDKAFILLCDPDVAMQRIRKRSEETGENISLSETTQKIARLHERYQEVASRLDYATIVNTNGRPEAIDLVVKSHLKNYLGIPMRKAVFLDKDGTFVDNSGYPEVIPADDIYPDSYEALKSVQNKGYDLFVVSSQPWPARGRMTLDEVTDIFESVNEQFSVRGVTIQDYGFCEHERKEGCPDKKPGTRLFENMIREYNIDTTKSYMVGDMTNDIIAGKRIGLETVHVNHTFESEEQPDYTISTIAQLPDIVR